MLEPQFDSLNTARKGASKSGIFGVPKVGSRKRNASGKRDGEMSFSFVGRVGFQSNWTSSDTESILEMLKVSLFKCI